MDKDVLESRRKAIDSLAVAIGFWGVDPLEARVYGTLFLSDRPLTLDEIHDDVDGDRNRLDNDIKVLERMGAVKEHDDGGVKRYEAESDFFEILQTVLRERREKELGGAIQEITDQRAYIEWRYEEEGGPELKFLAGRLEKLEKLIHLVDKAMFGLRTLAGIRGIFKR